MSKTYKNLRELLKETQALYADEVGFKFKYMGEIVQIKYARYVQEVKALGEYLLNLGLEKQRIAFISPNRYEWAVTYMAVATSNLIAVPLDRSLPENEFRALLLRSEAEVLVYDKKHAEEVERFKQDPEIPVKTYICMDTDFAKVLEKGKMLVNRKQNLYEQVKIDSDAMKFMLFTSGTTSASKCVMLSHHNICANISSVQDSIDASKEDTFLSFLPLHHTFECTVGFLFPVSIGAKIAYSEGIRYFFGNLSDFGVTVFINVPAMIEGLQKGIWKNIEKAGKTEQVKAMLEASDILMNVGIDMRAQLFQKIHDSLGGKLRFMISGAAALNPAVCKSLTDMGLIVYQGYGLTETSPVLSVEKKGHVRAGSVGQALPGVEVKMIDVNDEGIGEIVARGENVMLGYFEDKESTDAVLDADGWFHTGDLGRVDEDGYVFITGRKKDVIVLKNGKNVFPDELEVLVNQLPAVSESIVYGLTEADGDVVLNCKIVYSPEEAAEKFGELSEAELRNQYWNLIKTDVNKKMPMYKYIKNVIISTELLIRTTTNKVKRHEEMKRICNKNVI